MAPNRSERRPWKPAFTPPPEWSVPTRYSLLSRLENWDDQESWRDFFDTYWRLIYAVALRAGLSPTEAQDCVQETILSVAKNLKTFKRDPAKGPFKAWLRNLIEWRIKDQFRARGPQGRTRQSPNSELDKLHDPVADWHSIWDQEWEANLFAAALERVKAKVKEEHFQIFDLSVVKGWPVRKITELLGVSVANVYVSKHRVSALLKKELKQLSQKEL